MTVILKTSPNPLNPKEQGSLPAAVAVLAPGETLLIQAGTWPGDVSFPPNANVVGVSRNSVSLPGSLTFPGGGNIREVTLPIGSNLNYGGGSGIFRDMFMDGNFTATSGSITGTEVASTAGGSAGGGTGGGGSSIVLANVALGPLAIAGVSSLTNCSFLLFTQGGGIATHTNVQYATSGAIAAGQSTMINTTMQTQLTVAVGGSCIVPPGGNTVVVS